MNIDAELLNWFNPTPVHEKRYELVNAPASVPTADPSRAWKASSGEYSRTAPKMRREGPRASQA